MELIIKMQGDQDLVGTLLRSPESLIGIAALLVACISIFVSLRALNLQKKHNELSVGPLPYVFLGDYEDVIRIKLVNHGIGPLIIKSLSVSDGNMKKSDVLSFMPQLPNDVYWSNYTSVFEERPISPDGEITILEFVCDEKKSVQKEFRDECRKILSGLTLTCEYRDMYGKEFPSYSRKFDWFKRHNV